MALIRIAQLPTFEKQFYQIIVILSTTLALIKVIHETINYNGMYRETSWLNYLIKSTGNKYLIKLANLKRDSSEVEWTNYLSFIFKDFNILGLLIVPFIHLLGKKFCPSFYKQILLVYSFIQIVRLFSLVSLLFLLCLSLVFFWSVNYYNSKFIIWLIGLLFIYITQTKTFINIMVSTTK